MKKFKEWSTAKKVAVIVAIVVALLFIITGGGTFDWMERVFDPNNVR